MLPRTWITDRVQDQLAAALVNTEGAKALLDLAHADDVLRQDYADRFVYELLQNASDAQRKYARDARLHPNAPGRVIFELRDRWLLVANDGAPFSHIPDPGSEVSSIEAFTRIGESTKRDQGYAGNKGIGSRSVYEVCDRIRIVSGDYWLLFDSGRLDDAIRGASDGNEAARSLLLGAEKGVPMLRVAFWDQELEPEIESAVRGLRDNGFSTVLALRMRGDYSTDGLLEKVRQIGPCELVLLENVASFRFVDAGKPENDFELRLAAPQDGAVVVHTQGGPRRFRVFVHDDSFGAARVAVELSDDGRPKPIAAAKQVFHTFYPATGSRHGIPLLLHGYFELTPDRKDLARKPSNQAVFGQLLDLIETRLVPALLPGAEGVQLCDIVLPATAVDDDERAAWQRFTEDELPRADELCGWFRWRLCRRLSSVPFLRDAQGGVVKTEGLSVTRTAADLADELASPLHMHGGHARLSAMPVPVQQALGLVSLKPQDIETRLPDAEPTPVQAGRILRLLLTLDPDAKFTARLRNARIPILPADDGSLQPLPRDDDLFMVRVPRNPAESDQDDDEVEPSVPQFIDAWQLHPDVLADADVAAPSGPAALREEWVKSLNLKEFRVDDLLEGLDGRWIDDELTPAFLALDEPDKRALLRFVLELIDPGWFGAAVRDAQLPADPVPWYAIAKFDPLRDRRGWRRSHLVSRCPLPLADGSWVPAHKLVLGGPWNRIDGFDPGAAYLNTDVGVLDPQTEAPWLRQHIEQQLAQRTEAVRRNQPNLAALDAAAFCQHVYLRLGVHGGVAISAVHRKGGGGRWPGPFNASRNPHYGVPETRWMTHTQQHADQMWSSYWTTGGQIWCVRSVALAWQGRLVRWHEQQGRRHFLPTAITQRLRGWGTGQPQDAWRSVGGSHLQGTSLLMAQLRDRELWLDARCVREPVGGRLWYTTDQAPMLEPATHQRARFALTVTGRCLEPSDARFLGLERLDAPSSAAVIELLSALLAELPDDEAAPPSGRGLPALLRSVYEAAARLISQNELSAADLAALGVPCVVQSRKGPALCRVFPADETVFYDDEDLRISALSRAVHLAWLPDNHKSLARHLQLRLLSEADLCPVESLDDWEHEEADLLDELMRLKPAMFAFLCHASFLPSSAQLQVDSTPFKQRWDAWSREALDIEIIPKLHLRIGEGQPFEAFDKGQRCLLLPNGAGRRIIVQGRGDEELSVERLAPAVARLLGVRQHQLAVQTLLRRWTEQGDDFIDQTLVSELGVARRDYDKLADMVLEGRERRQRTRQRMRRLLVAAGLPTDDEQVLGRAPDDPDTLRWVRDQNALAGWAHAADAASVELQVPHVAREAFVEQRDAWKVAAICAAVAATEPEPDAAVVEASYQRLRLQQQPPERRYDPDGGAAAFSAGLAGFLRAHGAELPHSDEQPEAFLARVGSQAYDSAFPSPSEDVAGALGRFLPLVVSLVVGIELDRNRIMKVAADFGALRTDCSLAEFRDEIAFFLETQAGLAAAQIDRALVRFPLLPNDTPDSLSSVKDVLAKLKAHQDDRIRQKVHEYAEGVRKLVNELDEHARDTLLSGIELALQAPTELQARTELQAPTELDPAADSSAGAASSIPDQMSPDEASGPAEPKPKARDGQDDRDDPYDRYRVQAERNVLTGRRGEAFAVMCALHAWHRLAQDDPDAARARLEDLAACWDNLAPNRWELLRQADPTTWTTEHCVAFETLLKVGGTSVDNDRRGYDLFGLSRDRNRVVRVEVKATTGASQDGFIITDNELRVAGIYGDDYEIWHVRGVRGGRGVRVPTYRVYRNPAALVKEGKLVTDSIVRQVRPYRGV